MTDVKRKSDGTMLRKALHTKEIKEKRKALEVRERLGPGESPEARGLDRKRVEQDLDKKILNRLEIKYGQWISPERIAAARKETPEFQREKDFKRELADREPGKNKEEIDSVVGYVDGDDVRVRRNVDSVSFLTHERLHTLSHPEARKALGNHLYEGVTEELAGRESPHLDLHDWERKSHGSYEIQPPPEYYGEERLTVKGITSWVPESALVEAYFQGNDKRLEEFIDHKNGEGSWEKAKELLEKADKDPKAIEKARALLEGSS